MTNIIGITTALVTPFDEKDRINEEVLRQIIDLQISAGVEALAVVAGCGEYISLSPDERELVVRISVEQAAGRVKVFAGILDATTGEAVRNAKRFFEITKGKLDGLLVLTPFYILPSQAGIRNHFLAISESTPLPIILYNNPSRTKINLRLQDLEILCSIPSIFAIKECDRDLGQVAQKILFFGDRISFLCGDDDLAISSWSIGSVGSIMAISNLVPNDCVSIFTSFVNGDIKPARMQFQRLLRLMSLYRGPDHPGPLKEILGLIGLRVGYARLPAARIEDSKKERAIEILKELRLLS